MLLTNFKYLWCILDFDSKRRAILLIPLTLLNSAFELINIGIILPFIILLTGDKIPLNNLNYFEKEINYLISNGNLLVILFIFVISVTYLFRIYYTFKNVQFSFLVGASLNRRLFRNSISDNYENQIQINSNSKVSIIASKSGTVITNILMPFINSLNCILLLLVFYIFSGFYFGIIFYVVSIFIALTYYVIILTTKNSIKNMGDIVSIKTDILFKFLRETYDGIRELILSNYQEQFSNNFYLHEKSLRESQIFISFVSLIPKIVMEYLLIIFIVGFVFISRYDSISSTILVHVGVLIYVSQKILPLIHQLYNSFISIHSSKTIMNEVLAMLNSDNILHIINNNNDHLTINKIKFDNEIKLSKIEFKYQNSDKKVLSDVNLTILKGSTIGISGATGSGKSTIIDILTGLLTPISGKILIDGIELTKRQQCQWVSNFAYVPQKPFIIQGTVYDNLKLFNPVENKTLAVNALNLTNLIEISDDILNFNIKENGLNLSGGQCQRLSISRAIYSNKDILVLDEPTSALDLKTAVDIISRLKRLSKTLIIITHQIEILNLCDDSIFVDNGKIVNKES